jgi:hypothetical protein
MIQCLELRTSAVYMDTESMFGVAAALIKPRVVIGERGLISRQTVL